MFPGAPVGEETSVAPLAFPQDTAAIIESPVESSRLSPDVPRTLNFDKLHKLNPFYWYSDDTDNDDDLKKKIEKIEKRQKAIYDLILCGTVNEEKCKKLSKLVAKLFKKKEDEEDKPEVRPAAETTTKLPSTPVPVPTSLGTTSPLPPSTVFVNVPATRVTDATTATTASATTTVPTIVTTSTATTPAPSTTTTLPTTA